VHLELGLHTFYLLLSFNFSELDDVGLAESGVKSEENDPKLLHALSITDLLLGLYPGGIQLPFLPVGKHSQGVGLLCLQNETLDLLKGRLRMLPLFL